LEQEAYAEARLPRNAVAWLEALFDTKIVRLDRARSTRPFLFLALIHPSDPWPGKGHPEAMKMELPPRIFSHQCLEGAFSEVGLPLNGVLGSCVSFSNPHTCPVS
jgi:hypothetical protein